jgi:hypothetical protein
MARAALALLVVALAALGPAPNARAAFGRPQVIDSGPSPDPIALAANDRGDRVLVYGINGSRRVAFARAGRPFGPGHELPATPLEYEFRVAVGPRGDALIAWIYNDGSITADDVDDSCCYGVKAVVLPAGAVPGPVHTLWPKGTQVGVHGIGISDARHFGVVANIEEPRREGSFPSVVGVQARFSTRRGAWGPPEGVAHDELGATAFAVTGTSARLLYYRSTAIVERTRTSGGRWSRERRLVSGVPYYGSELFFTADARGGLLAAWTVRSRRIGAALRVAAGAPGRRARVHTVARITDDEFFFDPVLSAAGNGAALLRWQIRNRVYRSERPAGGRFSRWSFAYIEDDDNEEGRVAVSASGRWVSSFVTRGPSVEEPYALRAFTARFGGRVGPPRVVDTADSLLALPPTFDRAGRITLAYRDGSSVRVRVGR